MSTVRQLPGIDGMAGTFAGLLGDLRRSYTVGSAQVKELLVATEGNWLLWQRGVCGHLPQRVGHDYPMEDSPGSHPQIRGVSPLPHPLPAASGLDPTHSREAPTPFLSHALCPGVLQLGEGLVSMVDRKGSWTELTMPLSSTDPSGGERGAKHHPHCSSREVLPIPVPGTLLRPAPSSALCLPQRPTAYACCCAALPALPASGSRTHKAATSCASTGPTGWAPAALALAGQR